MQREPTKHGLVQITQTRSKFSKPFLSLDLHSLILLHPSMQISHLGFHLLTYQRVFFFVCLFFGGALLTLQVFLVDIIISTEKKKKKESFLNTQSMTNLLLIDNSSLCLLYHMNITCSQFCGPSPFATDTCVHMIQILMHVEPMTH